ncbi:MAG: hypothetical protein FJ146_15235 [Deltaproteobacteria bacterium]|nr:hypothetical protein [Deltaproteobacteria bacterium]
MYLSKKNQKAAYLGSSFGIKLSASLAIVSSIGISVQACDTSKSASFSDVKISQEAEAFYTAYDKLKETPVFKSEFDAVLKASPDYAGGAIASKDLKITIDGEEFKDADVLLARSRKVFNKGYKGSYGAFISRFGKNLGPITARDFQVARDIRRDKLKANGDSNRLNNITKTYQPDDFIRAVRADLVSDIFAKLAKDVDQAKLNLADGPSMPSDAAIGAVGNIATERIKQDGETVREVFKTIPQIMKEVNEGKYIKVIDSTLSACKKMVEQCVAKDSANDNTPGKQNYAKCETTNPPVDVCDNGHVRKFNLRFGEHGGRSESEAGRTNADASCPNHRWICECTLAFAPNSSGGLLYKDHNTQHCGWIPDLTWKAPTPTGFDKEAKCQEDTTCKISVVASKS